MRCYGLTLFVEEDDERHELEVDVVDDGGKQLETLFHPVHGAVLEQNLVVLGQGDDEQDGGDVVEAVDPLLPLRSLPAHVEHVEHGALELKLYLHNAGRLHTGTENVLRQRKD